MTLGDALLTTGVLFFVLSAIRYIYLKRTGKLLVPQGRPRWWNPGLCGLVTLLIIGFFRSLFTAHSANKTPNADPALAVNAVPDSGTVGSDENNPPSIYIERVLEYGDLEIVNILPKNTSPLSATTFTIPQMELNKELFEEFDAFTRSLKGRYPTAGYPKIGMYGGQYIAHFVATKRFDKWTIELRYQTRDSVELTVKAEDMVPVDDVGIKVMDFSAEELHQLEPLLRQYLDWHGRAKKAGVAFGASKEIGLCGKEAIVFHSSGALQIGIYTFSDDLADQVLDILSNGARALHAEVAAKVAKLAAGVSIADSKKDLENKEAEAKRADAQRQLDSAVRK